MLKHTVLRVGYVGTAGRNMEMSQVFNEQPSNYIWYATTGLPLPTGYYSGVARRSFDQTTYGRISSYSKLGYSNFNGLRLELERRYSRGLAMQVFYVMSNALSTGGLPSGGGSVVSNAVYQPEIFLPGAMPQNLDERIRFYRYSRDTEIPSTGSAGTGYTNCRSAAGGVG